MNANKETQKRLETLKRFGVATGALSGVALMTTQANALDVTKATGESTAKTDIETGAIWILSIVIVVFSARRVIAFFK
ncbi:hypothetical protein [Acinetobacter colistiniresistens]|uniref:hypothetical protein n=1 Tax=Acinetobacter colistiniresistens TaxID=280145 RepID=UPI000E5A953D|nr:hypothetical protein [Acinetobacter colistiniresistens]